MKSFFGSRRAIQGLALCLTLVSGSSLHAAKGSLAPPGTTGSQDNGAPGFMYRSPVYRTANIPSNKPVPSNDWWTGVLVRNDIVTMAAYPLIYSLCKVDGYGISMGWKDAGFVAQPAGGAVVGYNKRNWKIAVPVEYDLVVSNSLADGSVVTKLDDFGDWHIRLQTQDQAGHAMSSTLAAGSPVSYHSFANGTPRIYIADFDGNGIEFFLKDGSPIPLSIGKSFQSDHLFIKFQDRRFKKSRWYALFADPGTSWKRDDANRITLDGPLTSYVNVVLMPDQHAMHLDERTAEQVYAHGFTRITGTRAAYRYDEATATITTDFAFSIEALRSGSPFEPAVLTTLFPHQYKHLVDSKGLFNGPGVRTMRGPLRYFSGNSFQTRLKNTGILPQFNEPIESSGYDRGRLLDYLQQEQYVVDANVYGPDSYGSSKGLLRAAEYLVMADKLGNPKIKAYDPNQPPFAAKDAIMDTLYKEFEDWFTYSPGREKSFWADNQPYPFMTYNAPSATEFGRLTGWRASYGTQALNDQHFHYGYMIHAAAILALYHPTFAQDFGWAIDKVIRNIASPYRDDAEFPYLRYFNSYSGRSYASGWYWDDNYQGNDQESTSEAMNAWAGIYLWGLMTDNKVFRDLGLYMYWTEKSAIDEYWFDVDQENLSSDYPYTHAVILRDTAYEFDTHWGSGQIEELYGIQTLPVTAATLYFGLNQNYASRFLNQMLTINRMTNGGYNLDPPEQTVASAWDGVTLRLMALVDPALALAEFKFGKLYFPYDYDHTAIQAHETWAATYYFLHNMNFLGVPSADYSADQPAYGVFKKGNQYHLVAFNPSRTTNMTIHFRDAAGLPVATIEDVKPLQTVTRTL